MSTNGSGTLSWSSAGSGTISGSGTANFIPIFTAAGAIGNSQLYQSGTNIGVGTSNPGSAKLAVFGGNVGVGTSSPGAALSVAGNGLFGYSGTQAAPTNGLAVSGNVGIGTTSPGYKLAVVGTGNVTDDFTIGGGANAYTFDIDTGPVYTGTARPTKKITLSPEY